MGITPRPARRTSNDLNGVYETTLKDVRMNARPLGSLSVRGKSQQVAVYAIETG